MKLSSKSALSSATSRPKMNYLLSTDSSNNARISEHGKTHSKTLINELKRPSSHCSMDGYKSLVMVGVSYGALDEVCLMVKVDADEEDFKQIRIACLPEVLLAYNMILNFSSHYLSRDLLLKSMDLAALIAAEESGLAECFMAAERMPELVESFAVLSKTMIRADDRGAKAGKSKKKRNGETLDLWTVRAPSS